MASSPSVTSLQLVPGIWGNIYLAKDRKFIFRIRLGEPIVTAIYWSLRTTEPMKNKKMLRPLTTKGKAILIPSLLPGFIVKGAIKLPWSFKLWEIHALIIQQREHLDIIIPRMTGRKSKTNKLEIFQ